MQALTTFFRTILSGRPGVDPAAEFASLPVGHRLLLVVALTVVAVAVVAVLKRLSWAVFSGRQTGDTTQEQSLRNHPRLATVTGLLLSILTFGVYFAAVGLLLAQFDVSLTVYFAGASVVGLAVAFGIQGLIHDVVIGLTLVFSREINIEDVVEIAGKIGRVHSISLRFTTLFTFENQRVSIPNRSIGAIGRYPGGFARLFVDVELPEGDRDALVAESLSVVRAIYRQFRSVILAPPMAVGIGGLRDAPWRYLRIELRVWPQQTGTIEPVVRGRLANAMRKSDPNYADWMITTTAKAHAAE